jgi:tetratricopeptide (TPR) repeat protein
VGALLLVCGALPARADTPADALARSVLLEQAGELPAARRVARQAVTLGGGYDAQVRVGWLSLQLADRDGARAAYRAALALRPEGEEALLGETLVLALDEDWDGLARAARALVGAHPYQPWGWIRLGLAALQRGELDRAGEAYATALELRADLVEARLGLGFVARARGDLPTARRHCEGAAAHLPADDARVAACLAEPARGVTVVPSAWGMVAGYSDYYTRDLVWAAAAETEVLWDEPGPALRIGLAVARTRLRFDGDDFTQVLPGAGFAWRAADWSLAAGYLFAWQSGAGASTEHVAALGALGWLGDWGLGLDAAATLVPGEDPLLQLDAHAGWGRPGAAFQVRLTPGVQWAPGGDAGTGRGRQAGSGSAGTLRVSGELALVWRPLPWLSLEAGGWYGRRSRHVEAGGRWTWNADDVFQGGARLGAVFQVAPPVALVLRLRDDFGIEQAGRAYDFQLLTAQLGVVLSF